MLQIIERARRRRRRRGDWISGGGGEFPTCSFWPRRGSVGKVSYANVPSYRKYTRAVSRMWWLWCMLPRTNAMCSGSTQFMHRRRNSRRPVRPLRLVSNRRLCKFQFGRRNDWIMRMYIEQVMYTGAFKRCFYRVIELRTSVVSENGFPVTFFHACIVRNSRFRSNI